MHRLSNHQSHLFLSQAPPAFEDEVYEATPLCVWLPGHCVHAAEERRRVVKELTLGVSRVCPVTRLMLFIIRLWWLSLLSSISLTPVNRLPTLLERP